MKREKYFLILICIVAFSYLMLDVVLVMAEEKPYLKNGESIYRWYCSPCHGLKGGGNGFNAKNLDPRPANHTDADLMTRRTDKELFDAISAGGKGVGKSTLMPPWANTIDKAKIRSIVQYLRKLCRCQEE